VIIIGIFGKISRILNTDSPTIFPILHLNPVECDPPHRLTHPEKMESLCDEFEKNGFGVGFPVLLGYQFENSIQLISGTHRRFAAIIVGISIPVMVMTYEYIRSIWGTEAWVELLKNPPIYEGENV
jgi:hypothetical protein